MKTSRGDRLCAMAALLLVAVSCWRIAETHHAFWQTWDEPFHLAAGLEWWDQGRYTYERLHPPLGRICVAFLPHMAGLESRPGSENHWVEGNEILHTGGTYERNLSLARLGVLPFFVIAAVVVFLWGARCGGCFSGLCGVFVFVMLPPVLGHSGLATLDMATAALVPAALFAFLCWCEKPSLLRGGALGLTAGLAVMTKFSAVPFLCVGAGALLLLEAVGPKRRGDFPSRVARFGSAAFAVALCALTVWALYRFSCQYLFASGPEIEGKIDDILQATGPAGVPAKALLQVVPIPAVEFFWGIYDLFAFRRSEGHLAYFMGHFGSRGWWHFFPVMLLVKTPIPFLLLTAAGIGGAVLQWWRETHPGRLSAPIFCAAALLIAGAMATPNNGLRQVLAVYPLLAVVAGWALASQARAAQGSYFRVAAAVLLAVWLVVDSVYAHPDYLSRFNVLAGRDPSKIVVDSDLDWGQDLKRLQAACERRGIEELSLQYNGTKDIDLSCFGLPRLRELVPGQPATGWMAISRFSLRLGSGQPPFNGYAWLRDVEPVEKVGDSILLYFIPAK